MNDWTAFIAFLLLFSTIIYMVHMQSTKGEQMPFKPGESLEAICARCKKPRGDHKSKTFQCPSGDSWPLWSESVFKWNGKLGKGFVRELKKLPAKPAEKKPRKTLEERYLEKKAKEENMSIDYIRETYKVPARLGGRVRVNGKPGTIAGTRGQYLKIRFDGEKKSKNCHPAWEMEYEGSRVNTPPPESEYG